MSLRHMDANNDIENEKWASLAKSIYDPQPSGAEQTPADGAWPADSKEKEQLLLMTKKVDLYFELKKYPTEDAWKKIQTHIHNDSQGRSARFRRLITNPLMRLAAAILVAALLSVAGYNIFSNRGSAGQMIELSVSNQLVQTFTLPDGTLVSLNADSHLKYPKRFAKNTREVTLDGEAFFEVTPNKEKPFIIHARNAQIKVLGTSFNVNAFPKAESLEVIVKTGTVQVINKVSATRQSSELILHPGEKGTLVYASNDLQKSTNENPNFLAWKTHDLIFKATSLSEVIGNLEEVYKVKIRLDDPKLNGLLLTAHFNDYSLDFILKVIETTFQLETQRVDGQYILKAKS